MHRPHHPRQYSAVADAGVEDPKRRRRRLQIAEFERNPIADLGLLAAGRDEQEVFLAVVEEPEARRRDRMGAAPLAGLADGDGSLRAAADAGRCSDR